MSTNGERIERCGTCRFWVSASSECHRHAPTVVPALALSGCAETGKGELRGGTTAWPITHANEWCGEWASANAPAKATELSSASDSVAVRLFLARVAPTLDARDPAVLLAALLDQLPSDVRRVIVRTNGLDGRPAAGLKAAAREFKMSQGHVRALVATGEKLLTEVVGLLSRQRGA